MFKFLKDKLKTVVSKFSKSVEEEAPPKVEEKKQEAKPVQKPVAEKKKEASKKKGGKKEPEKKAERKEEVKVAKVEEIEVQKQEAVQAEVPQEKGFFSKLKDKFAKTEETVREKQVEQAEEKRGFFQSVTEKITTTKISAAKFDTLFGDLELAMLENNVALEVVDKIKEALQKTIVDKPIKRGRVEDEIQDGLKQSILQLFDVPPVDLIAQVKKKKPFVVCLVGINGSGKTTTIAKLAYYLQKQGISSVIAAADTFRAAAIHQLEEHAQKLGVKLIKHDYGSDAAAVAFDAIKHAEARGIDVVLIDTAGRLHSNADLMREMQKIIRVAKPDFKIFIGESITGNDCIVQAEEFNKAIGIDGIVLAKADIDEKGGTAISISYMIKKPILFLGTGQTYENLEAFEKEKLMEKLGL